LEFVVKNRELFFAGDLQSYIDRELYLYGGYEEPQIEAFLGLIPQSRRNTILDVGSNVGTHALRFACHFKHVHAFEPNPSVFRQLARNLSLNSLSNLQLHNTGLGDRKAKLDFHLIDKPNAGLGTFSKVEQYDLKLKVVGQALIDKGDDYLEGKLEGRVDAVKIDIQGFEPEALRGMRRILERDKPFVWFEVAAATLQSFDHPAALQDLFPYDFRLLKFVDYRRGVRIKTRLEPVARARIGLGDYVAVPAM
jgi:FkbM family methyltransferase